MDASPLAMSIAVDERVQLEFASHQGDLPCKLQNG